MKTVLAVDDNQEDLFLLERTLSLVGFEHRLLTAADGVEAETLLESVGACRDFALPWIIFLDVNMPRRGGHAFLQWLKRKPHFRRIPVVMLSSFDDPTDMDRAFELGAIACLRKPPAPKAVQGLINTLTETASGRADLSLGWVEVEKIRESAFATGEARRGRPGPVPGIEILAGAFSPSGPSPLPISTPTVDAAGSQLDKHPVTCAP